jgi:hypothetical protein
MRPPSKLDPRSTVDQPIARGKEAPDKVAYQRRLVIWLTHLGHTLQGAGSFRPYPSPS